MRLVLLGCARDRRLGAQVGLAACSNKSKTGLAGDRPALSQLAFHEDQLAGLTVLENRSCKEKRRADEARRDEKGCEDMRT